MNLLQTRNYRSPMQYFICTGFVLLTATLCYFSTVIIGYKIVALILLMAVSILAMLFEILPVLTAAFLSALIWNFFFIPPVFTFHTDSAEDLLMLLLYFFIALVNAVLTFKIRKEERKVRDKEEKESAIKLYNTLLNSLSHELRTPIATILSAVDSLKERDQQLSKTHQIELLNQIDIASVRLNRQVENLLNMSRLETGMLKLNLDWCDTNDLIQSIIQKLAINHNQTVIFTPNEHLPLYKYDRGLMEQAIQNILHNAINYTPESSIIEISAYQKNNHCVISISDNGKGIPASEINFLFDKFYRLPQSKPGGSGLGLSIVKGFIEAHHGKVSVINNMKGGANFTIEIPAEVSYINNLKNE